jgi:hypothetical protein
MSRRAKKMAKRDKMVKDNDKRVGTYGKKMVKFSNRANMAVIGNTGYIVTRAIEKIGASKIREELSKTGGQATAKTRALGVATLAGMGLVAGRTGHILYKLHQDNVLADGYTDRKRAATEARKKAQKAYASKK